MREFKSMLYGSNTGSLKSSAYTKAVEKSEDTIIVSNESRNDVGSMRGTEKQELSKIREASDGKEQRVNFKHYIKAISAKCFMSFLFLHLIIAFLSVIDTYRGTYGAVDGYFQYGLDFMAFPIISLFNILLSLGFVAYVVQTIISSIANTKSKTSKSLIALGIILLGLLLYHLNHFWASMQLQEFMGVRADNPYLLLDGTFKTWWMLVFYTLWIAILGFYIVNDFENILKVTGWDNKIRIIKDGIVKPKTMAYSISIILCLGFIAVAINAYMHANGLLL
jgi:succinate dehydrogenase / fumarate reductase cytochrome b subunit